MQKMSLSGTEIAYEIVGEGQPLVMLHGITLDHRHMKSFVERVVGEEDKGWQRIYIDIPGHGQSSADIEMASSDAILEALLAFLDALIPKQSFALAGMSYGGLLARGILHHRPQQVSGLLLTAPVIHARRDIRQVPEHVVLHEDEMMQSMISDPMEARMVASVVVVQDADKLSRLRTDFWPARMAADPAFMERLSENTAFSFDVDALDEPFPYPSLFLLGRQDSSVGFKDGWALMDSYPRAAYVVLDRAGHGLELEQEDLALALTREWLQRVAEMQAKVSA